LKTAQLFAARDIRIVDMPEQEAGPGEVLLDVTAVGVCGSDLHVYVHYDISDPKPGGPLILGHEAAGRVRAVGPGVTNLRVGQRVAIDPAKPCRQCEFCLKGSPNLCTKLEFLGLWPHHGAMRERMVHPARCCVPLPDEISDASGALLEPLGVALHAIRLAKIQLGDDVLITGCGGIGLLLVQLARLAGARHIYASDRYPWRLDQATSCGATTVLNADHVDVVAEVLRATAGRGVDVAIESAWVTDTANQCCEAARLGGRVVIVGIPIEEFIKLRAGPTRRKGLTIKLSRRMKHTYPASIVMAVSGKVSLDTLATHRFPLAQAAQAFETAANYADGVIRAMILPNM
jgi:L-iditol 2-dehydrogenase